MVSGSDEDRLARLVGIDPLHKCSNGVVPSEDVWQEESREGTEDQLPLIGAQPPPLAPEKLTVQVPNGII